ncbi:MAG: hypothetical protein KDC35_17335 [Acidobacteria bacterium]|nr:hypothetical protein [Acidobacteriota bacterium]
MFSGLLTAFCLFGDYPRLPLLEIGDPVPFDAIDTSVMVFLSEHEMVDEWKWLFQGVEYFLGVDSKSRVKYLSTYSRTVLPPEGIGVGATLEDVQKVNGIIRERNWEDYWYVIVLPSGWKLGFYLNYSRTNKEPKPEAEVIVLFKGTPAATFGGKH